MPVVSAAGRRFGTVDRVVAIGDEDVFRAIVLNTESGLRFVDRDCVEHLRSRSSAAR
jgi:hypothetical protein